MQDLKNRGEDTGKLWEDIQMCIAKTVMSIQPHLAHTYHTAAKQSSKDAAGEGTAGLCFEVIPRPTASASGQPVVSGG